MLQGKKRFKVGEIIQTEPYIKATINAFDNTKQKLPENKNFMAMISSLKDLSLQIIKHRYRC